MEVSIVGVSIPRWGSGETGSGGVQKNVGHRRQRRLRAHPSSVHFDFGANQLAEICGMPSSLRMAIESNDLPETWMARLSGSSLVGTFLVVRQVV